MGRKRASGPRRVVREDSSHARELLRITLQAAVPLWIEKLKARPLSQVQERASSKLCDVVAEKGDVLQFGGKGCAEAFNAVAEGLASLAFCPGGVTFLGDHWEAVHPDGKAA